MYNISSSVSAIYVQGKPYGTTFGDLKVYIPTLMAHITMGVAKITPISLNKSCYCNASECKPSIASYINTQNYVTANNYGEYSYPYYKYGSKIMVRPRNEDFLSCILRPDECDNSVE